MTCVMTTLRHSRLFGSLRSLISNRVQTSSSESHFEVEPGNTLFKPSQVLSCAQDKIYHYNATHCGGGSTSLNAPERNYSLHNVCSIPLTAVSAHGQQQGMDRSFARQYAAALSRPS